MTETKYTLNKSIITKSLIKDNYFIFATIPCSVLLLVIIACFLGLPIMEMIVKGIIVVIIAELCLLVPIYAWGRWRKSTTPAEIGITPGHLHIDNHHWALNEIQTLRLTPNIHPANKKCYLTVIETTGKQYRYYLGASLPSEETVFAQYAEFCDRIAFLCKDNPNQFQAG